MKLSDHFTSFICKSLKHDLGVTTVEEAQALSDDKLMGVRGIGKMFVQKLRRIKVESSSEYTRGFNDGVHTAIIESCRLITDNFQQCITQRQVELIQLEDKLKISMENIIRTPQEDSLYHNVLWSLEKSLEEMGLDHFKRMNYSSTEWNRILHNIHSDLRKGKSQ